MTAKGTLVVVALVVAVASQGGVGAAESRGTIAFVRYTVQSGHPRIYVVGAAGGRPRLLPLPVAAAQGPAWSPDGSRLAFVGGTNEVGRPNIADGDLYVATARGTVVRRLTRNRAQEAGASWSPEGRRLVFVRSPRSGTRSSLFVTRVDGGTAARLTSGSSLDTEPSWSRNGWIAFLRIDPKVFQSGIWLIRPDGSGLRRILIGVGVLSNPVWSPDGARLLVQEGRELVTVRPDGSGRRSVTTLSVDSRGNLADPQPAWSPDGEHVVYCQLRPGSLGISDIWVVAADGSGQRRLTRSQELDTDPSWGG